MNNREGTDVNSVKQRLIRFIENKNLSQGKFEKLASLSNGYVNNIRNSITDKTFDEKIKPAFPELNKLWVLHGEGEMLVSDLSNDHAVQKKRSSFNELPIGEQLAKIYEKESKLEEKVEELSEKLRLSQLINRTYLRSIINHFNIDTEEIKTAEKYEEQIEKLKQ